MYYYLRISRGAASIESLLLPLATVVIRAMSRYDRAPRTAGKESRTKRGKIPRLDAR